MPVKPGKYKPPTPAEQAKINIAIQDGKAVDSIREDLDTLKSASNVLNSAINKEGRISQPERAFKALDKIDKTTESIRRSMHALAASPRNPCLNPMGEGAAQDVDLSVGGTGKNTFELDRTKIPVPQPHLRTEGNMRIAALGTRDVMVRAVDPASERDHDDKLHPKVEIGVEKFDGGFHHEWSERLIVDDCECLAEFFTDLAKRSREASGREVPQTETPANKLLALADGSPDLLATRIARDAVKSVAKAEAAELIEGFFRAQGFRPDGKKATLSRDTKGAEPEACDGYQESITIRLNEDGGDLLAFSFHYGEDGGELDYNQAYFSLSQFQDIPAWFKKQRTEE